MYSLLVLSTLACFFALLFTPLVRRVAVRNAWLDHPDGRRKTHHHPVPRLGGVAVAVSIFATVVVWLVVPLRGALLLHGSLDLAVRLLPAALLVLMVGLADDLRGLTPFQKLAGQTLAALLACGAGIRMESLAGHAVHGLSGIALTVFWLLLCMNAFNLIDGMDGLAAGVGFLASLTALLAAVLQGNVSLALAVAPLAGALLGFLWFNRPPASIFLGDGGSLTIGFLLGCYGALWSQKCVTLLGLAAPLMALAVPLVEIGVSIVRRYLKGDPLFLGDHNHIHHRLLERGLTPRRAVLILYAATGVGAALALLASAAAGALPALAIVLFSSFVWIGIQSLGYAEFGAASRLVWGGGLRRAVRSEIAIEELRVALTAADGPEQVWTAVLRVGQAYGFSSVEMRWYGSTFRWASSHAVDSFWSLWIPFDDGDFVRLQRSGGAGASLPGAGPLAETLAAALGSRRLTPR